MKRNLNNKLYCNEEIKIGEVVKFNKDGKTISSANVTKPSKRTIGVARRNIKKGETIEYSFFENTKDIVIKV